jgi:hypothetical protein
MKTKEKELPKWFKGTVYDEGTEVKNRYTGQCYTLSAKELSIYDLILGCEMVGDYKTMQKGLAWFRSANAEAYMILLD